MTRRADTRQLDRFLLTVCLATLGITILYPSLRMFGGAVVDWRGGILREPTGFAAVRNTVVMSLASVATAGVVGTLLALLLTRYSFPGRRLLAGLAYLPFALPPLVGVVSFYYLIGRDGFLPRFLERCTPLEKPFLQGALAILLIHTYSFYVFFYAMVSAALESLDFSPVEAARTLGASRLRAFFKVTVPMLRPALVGAALLTFMSSGASFSAPLIFGEGFPMLSVQIVHQRDQFNHAEAQTLTLVLAIVSLLGVLLFRSRQRGHGTASKGVARVAVRSRTGRLLAGVCAFSVILVLLLPHLTIVWLSFVNHREWYTELIPLKMTFANYVGIFNNPDAFAPIRNSLWMSAVAAVATLLVAVPCGYLIGRKRTGGRGLNALAMTPWALPGTVIGMCVLTSFSDLHASRQVLVWMIPLAYFIRSVPLLTRMATASIEPFDAGLIEAGRCLGASRFYTLRRVAMPLVAPALIAGTVLVFAMALGEFVSSILLYVPANRPISVQIFTEMRGSGIGSAFAYSVFLMLLVATAFVFARRVGSRVL